MELSGTTWIIAADGTHARVFEERARACVRELPERAVHALESDNPRSHRHLATVHDRHGPGRRGAGERTLSDEAARRFLRRLADKLQAAARLQPGSEARPDWRNARAKLILDLGARLELLPTDAEREALLAQLAANRSGFATVEQSQGASPLAVAG